MKATQLLIDEHKLILRALDVLDAMSTKVENAGDVDKSDIEEILQFLRWFADAHHQTKEERILFPALTEAAASQVRPVEHMILEHNHERALVEEIEKEARLSKIFTFGACANRLSSILRNHIYKEDRILFPSIDNLLTPDQDEAIVDELNRFETTFDKELLQEKVKDLRALEWKYLRR